MTFRISLHKCGPVHVEGSPSVDVMTAAGRYVGHLRPFAGEPSTIEMLEACNCSGQLDTLALSKRAEFSLVHVGSNGSSVIHTDPTGCMPLYYGISPNGLVVSDSVYEVLRAMPVRKFSDIGVWMLLAYQFTSAPYTLFVGVHSTMHLEKVKWSEGRIERLTAYAGCAAISEDRSAEVLGQPSKLRALIVNAHYRRLVGESAIMLSGGIDSCVMLASLVNDLGARKRLSSVTFSVKNAEQTEVSQARQCAKHFGIIHEIIEVDPDGIHNLDDILHVNFPYVGIWLSGPISRAMRQKDSPVAGIGHLRLFAGQDTRLHTPHIHWIDQLLLRRPYLHRAIAELSLCTVAPLLDFRRLNGRVRKLAQRLWPQQRASELLHQSQFSMSTVFTAPPPQLDPVKARLLNIESVCRGLRQAYNAAVDVRWDQQYVCDMQYMRGSAQLHGNDCVLPFYDWDLAQYSARIPMNLALARRPGIDGHTGKATKVDKFCLRNAFRDDLPWHLLQRHKAVCITNHLFLNGFMRKYVDSYFSDPALAASSIYERLGLSHIIEMGLRRSGTWGIREYDSVVVCQNVLYLEHIARRLNVC